jgi:4-hydroxybenzoate polyprenyltransferase
MPGTRLRHLAAAALPGVLALRPRQWTKNLLLFAGLIFAGRLLDPLAVARAGLAFVVFCLVSGVIYIVNDLTDLERDRLHPTKRLRPLASGRLSPRAARLWAAGALLAAAALTALLVALPPQLRGARLVFSLWPLHLAVQFTGASVATDLYTRYGGSGLLFALAVAAYLGLMLAYSFRLKHIVLVDVFVLAAGFVLRAMAGAFAVAVHISPWLYLCTILLALFLALGKRRQELTQLTEASAHRRSLALYTPQLLDQLIVIVTSSMLMSYSLYTFQGETGNNRLMVTIPFVLYGVFRYLYLIYVQGEGGSPEEVLLRDSHIRASVVLCALTIGLVLYVVPQ